MAMSDYAKKVRAALGKDIMLVFECRICGGRLRPDPDETLDLGFFHQDDLRSLNVAPWVATVVRDAVTGGSQASFQRTVWNPEAKERPFRSDKKSSDSC